MRSLSTEDQLRIWESAQRQTPTEWAVGLLCLVNPELTEKYVRRMAIGDRDELLLKLRWKTFGRYMESRVDCPNCSDPLELCIDIKEMLQQKPKRGSLSLQIDDYSVVFRLPTSDDLLRLSEFIDRESARRNILQACILELTQDGRPCDTQMPAVVERELLRQMEMSDPMGDIRLALRCPQCDHGWQSAFDIVAYFWREIDYQAGQILNHVHILAKAYGWAEKEILALSPCRRQFYLNKVLQ